MKIMQYTALIASLLISASGLSGGIFKRFKGTAIRQVHNKTEHDVTIGGKTIKANSTSPIYDGDNDIEIKTDKAKPLTFTIKGAGGAEESSSRTPFKRTYKLYDEDWKIWDAKTLIKKKEKNKGKEAILTIKEDGTLRIDQFKAE